MHVTEASHLLNIHQNAGKMWTGSKLISIVSRVIGVA